jgi:hypothetical protein
MSFPRLQDEVSSRDIVQQRRTVLTDFIASNAVQPLPNICAQSIADGLAPTTLTRLPYDFLEPSRMRSNIQDMPHTARHLISYTVSVFLFRGFRDRPNRSIDNGQTGVIYDLAHASGSEGDMITALGNTRSGCAQSSLLYAFSDYSPSSTPSQSSSPSPSLNFGVKPLADEWLQGPMYWPSQVEASIPCTSYYWPSAMHNFETYLPRSAPAPTDWPTNSVPLKSLLSFAH